MKKGPILLIVAIMTLGPLFVLGCTYYQAGSVRNDNYRLFDLPSAPVPTATPIPSAVKK